MSRLGRDGSLAEEAQAVVNLRLILTQKHIELLDRAREILAHGGRVPTNCEIFERAMNDLLDRRDPMRKAERAEWRKKKWIRTIL